MSDLQRITIRMEGLPEEGGHLRLTDFLKRLEDWKKVLNQVGQADGSGEGSDIYYRVVNLSHSSPVTIELEPIRKPVRKKKRVSLDRAKVRDISERPMRVLHEMNAIQKRAQVSEEIDSETLEVMRSLIPSQSNGISSASIEFGNSTVVLDQEFSSNLRKLVEGEEQSYGEVEGRLEILNIHSPKHSCCIFPPVGAERIRCYFPPHLKQDVISAIGKSVRAFGRKHYRGASMFPYLFDVEKIRVLEPRNIVKLSTLEGAMNGSHSGVTIQELRNDW